MSYSNHYKAITTTLIYGLLCYSVSNGASIAKAQEGAKRPELFGKLELESTVIEEKNSYKDVQESVLKYFEDLKDAQEKLRSGDSVVVNRLNEQQLQYISAVYLYCSIQKGVCLIPLDALLEVDLITSKMSSKNECPNLKQFWQIWIKLEMERRQEYLTKTGYFHLTEQFKKTERLRYVKCERTIQDQLSFAGDPSQFFKMRYSPEQPKSKVIAQMLALLKIIEKKIPNVYSAVGITFKESDTESSSSGQKKPSTKSRSAPKRTR